MKCCFNSIALRAWVRGFLKSLKKEKSFRGCSSLGFCDLTSSTFVPVICSSFSRPEHDAKLLCIIATCCYRVLIMSFFSSCSSSYSESVQSLNSPRVAIESFCYRISSIKCVAIIVADWSALYDRPEHDVKLLLMKGSRSFAARFDEANPGATNLGEIYSPILFSHATTCMLDFWEGLIFFGMFHPYFCKFYLICIWGFGCEAGQLVRQCKSPHLFLSICRHTVAIPCDIT